MAVPFIDLSRADPLRVQCLEEAAIRVLGHRQFILGPEVEAFEEMMGEYVGAPVVGMSSGTDALLAALMALRVGPGDLLLTTPFSFFATAGVARRLGATPVFADIDPQTFMLDPVAIDARRARDVKVAIPVHLFGDLADVEAIQRAVPGAAIVEDAAQALGGRDGGGRHAGVRGAIGAFSFFPTKNLGACGDAGMACSSDRALLDALRRIRAHGQSSQYRHEVVGGNFRLDAIQAAFLAAAFPFFEADTAARRANAARYGELFGSSGLAGDQVVLPRGGAGHTWHQYVIRVPGGRRDEVQARLRERGIGTAVYYPVPFHLQPCFRDLGYRRGAFPRAEAACGEVLALPVFPGLRPAEQEEVVDALREILLNR